MYRKVVFGNVFLLLDFKNKLSCKYVCLFSYLYMYVFIKTDETRCRLLSCLSLYLLT